MTAKEAKRAIRDFAIKHVPAYLEDAGGRLRKTQLHALIEQDFQETCGSWPSALCERDESGHRHAANAIAWALSFLTRRNVIHPTTRTDLVELRHHSLDPDHSQSIFKDKETTSASQTSDEENLAVKRGSEENELEKVVQARARSAMQRAIKAGLPYDESFVEDSLETLRQQNYSCALSGIRFDVEFRTPGAGGTHFAPSPDRLQGDRGYTKQNVRWVLWCINRGKGELDMDMYIQICRRIAERN